MDATRPSVTSDAASFVRQAFHYPPAENCSFGQFLPGQNSNSFRGETLIRLTNPVRRCLAVRLDGTLVAHNPKYAFAEYSYRANPRLRPVTMTGVLFASDGKTRGDFV